MKRWPATVVAILLSSIAFAKDAVSGRWLGESSCEQKESACHDESVVYRFAPVQTKPGFYAVTADKIVEGKPVNMGTLEFQYIENEHALVCEYAQGVWRLRVDGETITGTLTRPDNILFRRLTLRKEE